MEMSAGEWISALGQVLLVIAISFVGLCAVTSFVRFQLLSEKAAETEELGGEEEKGFRLVVMNQISAARKIQKPISVVLLKIPADGAPIGEVEKVLAAALRHDDKVMRAGENLLGLLLRCGSEKTGMVAQRLLAGDAIRSLAGCEHWRFGVAGYPEHGYKTSELYTRASAMVEESDKNNALISGMAEAEAVAEKPEPDPTLDPVTGFIRDDQMIGTMRRFIGVERRYDRPASMIYFQIDGGDRLQGKPGLDAVLKELSGFFVKMSREGDVIARHGGTGFVMGLTAWPKDALAVAQRIASAVRKHVFKSTLAPKITLSGGVSGHPEVQGTAVQYFVAAEAALEQGRKFGRNQIIKFEPAMMKHLPAATEGEDRL